MPNFNALPEDIYDNGANNFGPVGPSLPGIKPYRFRALFKGTGLVYDTFATTDLHLVGNDATVSDWASRVGSFAATAPVPANVGLETPFYPKGEFDGVNFAKGVSSDTDGFLFPFDSSHQFNNTDQRTIIVKAITGDFLQNEFVTSQFTGLGFNHYISFVDILGIPYIEARVQHTVTDAVVKFQCSRNTIYYIKITFNGPTRELTLAINGVDIENSYGQGDVLTGGTEDLALCAATVSSGFGMVTGKLIEYQRLTEILSTPVWRLMCFKSWGIYTVKGTSPLSFERNSKAGFTVNNTIWQYGHYMPRINEYGYLPEEYVINVLQNSTFTQPLGVGFSVNGGAAVSYITDPDANSNAGGTALQIQNDLGGGEKGIYWIYGYVGSNSPCVLSLQYKALTPATNIYYQVFCFDSSRFYDATTQSWTGVNTYNEISYIDLQKQYFDIIFNYDVTGGPAYIAVSNGLQADDNAVAVFHVQFSPGFDKVGSPFVYDGVAGGNAKYSCNLIYDGPSSIDYTEGSAEAYITPLNSSLDPVGAQRVYLGGTTGFVKNDVGFPEMVLSDGTNSNSLNVPYNRGQTLNYKCEWGPLVGLKQREKNSGLVSSGAFTSPLDSGDLAVGCSAATSNHSGAYVRDLRIR